MKHSLVGLHASIIRILQILTYAGVIAALLLISDKFINPQQVIQIHEISINTLGEVEYKSTVFEPDEPTAWTGRIDLPSNGGVICSGSGIISLYEMNSDHSLKSISDLLQDQCQGYITEGSTFTFTFIPLKNEYRPTVYRGLVTRP